MEVSIQPFANGNGRHGRFMADLLLKELTGKIFTGGQSSLGSGGEARTVYIKALKAADTPSFRRIVLNDDVEVREFAPVRTGCSDNGRRIFVGGHGDFVVRIPLRIVRRRSIPLAATFFQAGKAEMPHQGLLDVDRVWAAHAVLGNPGISFAARMVFTAQVLQVSGPFLQFRKEVGAGGIRRGQKAGSRKKRGDHCGGSAY